MTSSKNQFMVIMDQSEVVTVRKVQFFNKKQKDLKLYPDLKGVKLMDTFPIIDTGNAITEDSGFAVVSLT